MALLRSNRWKNRHLQIKVCHVNDIQTLTNLTCPDLSGPHLAVIAPILCLYATPISHQRPKHRRRCIHPNARLLICRSLILIHCNDTPASTRSVHSRPPNFGDRVKTYKVVRQPITFPPKSRRHLRKTLRLDEMVERERREHCSIAMDIGFD